MKFKQKILSARAALEWTRDDLYKKSGVSPSTIRDIETIDGKSYSKRTEEALIDAFQISGITFTDYGIEQRDIYVYEYHDYMDVLIDIENTISPSANNEIIFHCADDSRSSDAVNLKLEELKAKGYKFRSTICEGNTFITGEPDEYRWIPKEYFSECEISAIYGNKYVQHVPGEKESLFMIMHSKAHANIMRKQFEYWWTVGKKLRSLK